MTKKQSIPGFSFSARLLSFRYAFRGIAYLVKTQHNVWIHLFITLIVIICGFLFSVSNTEWILLVLAIGMVLAAESFNTAIELLVDKISPDYDKTAGKIKDVAAGAVLFCAAAAAILGVLIFVPRIF